MIKSLVPIFFLTLFSCNQTNESNSEVSQKGETHVLKYDDSYSHLFSQSVSGLELTQEDIKICETLLKKFLLEYNASTSNRYAQEKKNNPDIDFDLKDILIEPDMYGRQYIGVVLENGYQWVYGNFFCGPERFNDLDKRLVDVEDGGKCYFNFKVDLKEKKVFDFTKNGEA